jgi:transposase-like protein
MHHSPLCGYVRVTGALNEPLTLMNLPPRDTVRWTRGRKAQIVAALESGLITSEQACRWYNLVNEELAAWRRANGRGMLALRASRVQQDLRLREALAEAY